MLIGYAAGGEPDTAARIVGQKMTQALGQAVVRDNRAGANGPIAALHGEIAKGMQAPEVSARLAHEGSEGIATTPAAFGAFLRSEQTRFA